MTTISHPVGAKIHVLLAYIADLELEVDRLRKQGQFALHETRDALERIQRLCGQVNDPAPPTGPMADIQEVTKGLKELLHDLRENLGYHPAHDQVLLIAVRPLIEQVCRWQQRLWKAPHLALRLELQSEHMEWFPARLRHILDNLLSNAVRYRDPDKGESRVTIGLRSLRNDYELLVSDNGLGLPPEARDDLMELFHRSAPTRAAGFGVGLPVVKLLVEQSGGSLTFDSGAGQGTTVVAMLPRFDSGDYLN